MNYDYNKIFARTSCIRSDINLYSNSHFVGFVRPETVQEYLKSYHKIALDKVNDISWDYIILYAIIQYESDNNNENHNNMISANFMTLEIPYGFYRQYAEKFCNQCRSFFIRGRKES